MPPSTERLLHLGSRSICEVNCIDICQSSDTSHILKLMIDDGKDINAIPFEAKILEDFCRQ